MNKIIERLDAIAGGDPWKMRDSLRIFIDELKEKRDVALKEKETQEIVGNDDSAVPISEEDMIKLGKELVKEFDSV